MTEPDDPVFLLRRASIKQQLLALYRPEEADKWFERPLAALEDRRPIDLIMDDVGYLHLCAMLHCISDGTYT